MDVDLPQLRALSAVVEAGTFEAAARALHVTPSAVSQRIRALEAAAGRVLLVRSKPVRVTDSGRSVLRLARQVELLADEARRELGGTGHDGTDDTDGDGTGAAAVVRIAVNADSLATWVLPALAAAGAAAGGAVCFDLHREDQERTADLLREGAVMAAVTADAEPVPGCSATRLGAMRYRPVATAAFAARWFPEGPAPGALAAAPVVVFDRDDDLQHGYLRRRTGRDVHPPASHVPASADYLAAVRLGLGWGMLPDLQAGGHVRSGELVVLDPAGTVDVPLHWQQWKLRSALLDGVAAAVVTAAREHLHP